MSNFLNAPVADTLHMARVVVVWQVTPVGIGNSPPAMNVADSPEIAVRLGSASVRTTPALSMARRVAVTDGMLPMPPNVPVAALPATSGALLAVNGLVLLYLTTAVP